MVPTVHWQRSRHKTRAIEEAQTNDFVIGAWHKTTIVFPRPVDLIASMTHGRQRPELQTAK
jgi:hypothetical protein